MGWAHSGTPGTGTLNLKGLFGMKCIIFKKRRVLKMVENEPRVIII